MKKVLVIGGCGFIGSHLVDELLRKKIKVIVLDSLITGRIINLDIRPDPYNDGESYMEAYKNLTQDIK